MKPGYDKRLCILPFDHRHSYVGRPSFLHAVTEWHSGTMTREAAIREIADKFLDWIEVFETAGADLAHGSRRT